jgi:nicotinamide riboside kinase
VCDVFSVRLTSPNLIKLSLGNPPIQLVRNVIPPWRYYVPLPRIGPHTPAASGRMGLIIARTDLKTSPTMSYKDTPPREQQLPCCLYIIGPQSTGKTTLVNALARAFVDNVPVIREVARKVMAEKGYSKVDVDSTDPERRFKMQRDIFTAQVETENSLLNSKDLSFLSDRSAIDPLIYLLRYSGTTHLTRLTSTDLWNDVRDRYRDVSKSLILLLLPVEKFLDDDDIRYVPKSLEDWYALADDFRAFMVEEKIPFLETGDECLEVEERVLWVLSKLLPFGVRW